MFCKVDTGAAFTAIPHSLWREAPWASEIDSERYPQKSVSGVYGVPIKARRVPVFVTVTGEDGSGAEPFGPCDVDFLFDEALRESQIREHELARQARAELRQKEIAEGRAPSPEIKPLPAQHVLLGMGGGIYRLGGLCVDGTPGLQHAVFVVK